MPKPKQTDAERETGYYGVKYEGHWYIASFNAHRVRAWAVLFPNGEFWYVTPDCITEISQRIDFPPLIDSAMQQAEKTAKALDAGIERRVLEQLERERAKR